MGGGPTATALCAAAALGGRTAMIDRIGNRPPPELILAGYQKHGVDVSRIAIEPSSTTGHASVLVRLSDGSRSITYLPGTAAEFKRQDLDLEIVAQSRILHMNGRHPELASEAIEIAKKSGTPVSFDGGANRFRLDSRPLFEAADILIVSQHFGQAATGQTETNAILAALASTGASIVGLTAGEQGSFFLLPESGDAFAQQAVTAEKIVDTTGCGDIFHGSFLYHLSQGCSPRSCAKKAAKLAALNCQGLGGRYAIESSPHDSSDS